MEEDEGEDGFDDGDDGLGRKRRGLKEARSGPQIGSV